MVALGQSIVQALGADEHGDVLGRWMAHRVAELIGRAEEAKSTARAEAAKKEATKVILDLWQHRSHWPKGWPPVSAAVFAERFAAPQSRPNLQNPTGSPWLDRLGEFDAIADEEERLWRQAALLDLGQDHQYDEFLVQEADEEERALIREIAEQAELARSSLLRLLRQDESLVGDPTERGLAVASRLGELAIRRAELVQEVMGCFDTTPDDKRAARTRNERRPG